MGPHGHLSDSIATRQMGSVLCVMFAVGVALGGVGIEAQSLPDAPSALMAARLTRASAVEVADADDSVAPSQQIGLQGMQSPPPNLPPPPPCVVGPQPTGILPKLPLLSGQAPPRCEEDPIQLIVSSPQVAALNAKQKGILAVRDIIDPFNLIVLMGGSAVSVGANAHSAYGPGLKGFGRLTGYSLVEDAQGEFFGTYLIPSLTHEDPRYHRMPGAPVRKRIFHALAHTFVTRHDDGSRMPNYATLFTYPISAELSNLYVPGIADDGPATGKRIALGLATDPAGSLIAEFLPDIAKRIHVHVLFMQQIINQVALGAPAVM